MSEVRISDAWFTQSAGYHAEAFLALIEKISTDTSWQAQAACRDKDPALFFPPGDGRRPEQAKAICDTCPVLEQCRKAGAEELYGVWGGMTVEERRSVRRERRRERMVA